MKKGKYEAGKEQPAEEVQERTPESFWSSVMLYVHDLLYIRANIYRSENKVSPLRGREPYRRSNRRMNA